MNNRIVEQLLQGKGENYILPFFWQHGESEERLRLYMQKIHESGCGAVCVESRPHPDFCGPKWWRDMDIILEEAQKRGMKVWILDDSHFPTGFANGAVKDKPVHLRRQSVLCSSVPCPKGKPLRMNSKALASPQKLPLHGFDYFFKLIDVLGKPAQFDDDRLLGVYAYEVGQPKESIRNITAEVQSQGWSAPKGNWRVYTVHLSRNFGAHRDYINMMDRESCKILLDAVYEPHWEHYQKHFGKTIAGFFSDEPELGNGLLYKKYNTLGTPQDLPWSRLLEEQLQAQWGDDFARFLPLLWENDARDQDIAEIRYTYMDKTTRLVEACFSHQLADWCHDHGVQYIGHVIEDNNQHARTGCSLGHYFRGLSGQDMSGIDDIGGQVLPQQEDISTTKGILGGRDGEFYHYVLAKLASSAAAIEPRKKGRAMCEIFGNYGWAEGVGLEKYLADHFMVRGVNHYVPHAFSAKEFPDRDCPPHFYADGNDAQFRHFGQLIQYMNRVCGLISGGHDVAPVAILYHGEAEWTGKCMFIQKPAHVLADAQIEYDFLPQDVFAVPENYHEEFRDGILRVNTQEYRALVVPYAQFATTALAEAAVHLHQAGFPVFFIDNTPDGLCDGENDALVNQLKQVPVISLEALSRAMETIGAKEVFITPTGRLVRYLHYVQSNGAEIYYFVNEAAQCWQGMIRIPYRGKVVGYNAWDNRLEEVQQMQTGNGTVVTACLEPRKSLILLCEDCADQKIFAPVQAAGRAAQVNDGWFRSTCKAVDYPAFGASKELTLPDNLAEEQPKFSGFVRYSRSIEMNGSAKTVLELSDAAEGVELFVNGKSAGLQIVPPYRYDITHLVNSGKNDIVIEVATTLDRQVGRPGILAKFLYPKPSSKSGIIGEITLYQQE